MGKNMYSGNESKDGIGKDIEGMKKRRMEKKEKVKKLSSDFNFFKNI